MEICLTNIVLCTQSRACTGKKAHVTVFPNAFCVTTFSQALKLSSVLGDYPSERAGQESLRREEFAHATLSVGGNSSLHSQSTRSKSPTGHVLDGNGASFPQ